MNILNKVHLLPEQRGEETILCQTEIRALVTSPAHSQATGRLPKSRGPDHNMATAVSVKVMGPLKVLLKPGPCIHYIWSPTV